MSGNIESGDADKLSELAQSLGLDTSLDPFGLPNSEDQALCLNSNGGSYLEGRLLSSIVHSMGITTRMMSGAECYSACAFLFMSGRFYGLEQDRVSRFVHVNAALGFHAPYLSPEHGKQYNSEDIENTVRLISLIISDLIEFGSTFSTFEISGWFPTSLLADLLKTDQDNLVLVDTVEEANRWNIQLEGFAPAPRFSSRDYAQACVNFQNWMLDRPSHVVSEYEIERIEAVKLSTPGGERDFIYFNDLGLAHEFCLMTPPSTSSGWMQICSYSEYNGLILGDCAGGLSFGWPWYAALPPRTLLSSLAPD